MKKEITKSELNTGDIVITRNGSQAVVIREKEIFLFQGGGYELMDIYGDDLLMDDGDEEYDIVAAYRGSLDNPVSFDNYKDGECLFNFDSLRDYLTKNALLKNFDKNDVPDGHIQVIAAAEGREYICASIKENDICDFLSDGTPELAKNENIENVMIDIPSWRYSYVLLYNREVEKEYRKKFEQKSERLRKRIKPAVLVSGLNIEIYGNCIICRKDENGKLESLTSCDYTPIIMRITEDE